jgi:hypothetical protein
MMSNGIPGKDVSRLSRSKRPVGEFLPFGLNLRSTLAELGSSNIETTKGNGSNQFKIKADLLRLRIHTETMICITAPL